MTERDVLIEDKITWCVHRGSKTPDPGHGRSGMPFSLIYPAYRIVSDRSKLECGQPSLQRQKWHRRALRGGAGKVAKCILVLGPMFPAVRAAVCYHIIATDNSTRAKGGNKTGIQFEFERAVMPEHCRAPRRIFKFREIEFPTQSSLVDVACLEYVLCRQLHVPQLKIRILLSPHITCIT